MYTNCKVDTVEFVPAVEHKAGTHIGKYRLHASLIWKTQRRSFEAPAALIRCMPHYSIFFSSISHTLIMQTRTRIDEPFLCFDYWCIWLQRLYLCKSHILQMLILLEPSVLSKGQHHALSSCTFFQQVSDCCCRTIQFDAKLRMQYYSIDTTLL